MQLRQLLQPMINELALAMEKVERQACNDGLQLHEHVYGWFLLRLESKIKRFVNEQERFSND